MVILKKLMQMSIAKKLIKWRPKVNLDVGIKKFVNWYKLNSN